MFAKSKTHPKACQCGLCVTSRKGKSRFAEMLGINPSQERDVIEAIRYGYLREYSPRVWEAYQFWRAMDAAVLGQAMEEAQA